jgi:hypothetical protein
MSKISGSFVAVNPSEGITNITMTAGQFSQLLGNLSHTSVNAIWNMVDSKNDIESTFAQSSDGEVGLITFLAGKVRLKLCMDSEVLTRDVSLKRTDHSLDPAKKEKFHEKMCPFLTNKLKTPDIANLILSGDSLDFDITTLNLNVPLNELSNLTTQLDIDYH